MRNLIYYPTFEPRNETWLKYALIYIDSFSPIIPPTGQAGLSKQYLTIRQNTNLINEVEPRWQHGENAAMKSIQELENVFESPERYSNILHCSNPLQTFKNNQNWNFKLLEEKFNSHFKYFCLKNSLGRETAGGILLSKELAHFYMTYLADEIAFEQKTNLITDDDSLDRLSNYLRVNGNEELAVAAQTTIALSLPEKLENISINKLIEFRNDTSINELRESFNKSLNEYLESIEHNFNTDDFIDNLKQTNSEFIKEMSLFLGGLISTTLGATLLLQSGNPNYLETTKAIVEGTTLAIGGGYAMKKSWSLNEDKRNARKFLTRISDLKMK